MLAPVLTPSLARALTTRTAGPTPAVASHAAAGDAPPADDPLDVTAETAPDTTALSDTSLRRVLMLAAKQNEVDQETQVRLDGMRAEFDNAQAERAELMREANVLRDMALEQQKRDDEILKKWIALI